MKSISITDLQLVPELSHLRQLDFLDPANTELLRPVLKTLGFDLDYPVQFIPSQHRNLQGKVVVSYQIVGELEINESFLSSPWATAEDRMIAAGYRDVGLAKDLAERMVIGRDYEGENKGEALDPSQLNPDADVIANQIKALEAAVWIIRGDPFKEDGSRATLCESGKLAS